MYSKIFSVNADTGNVMKYEIEPEDVTLLVEGFPSMHKALASVPSTAPHWLLVYIWSLALRK